MLARSHFVPTPPHVRSEGDLLKLFDPLITYIDKEQHQDQVTARAVSVTNPVCGGSDYTSTSVDDSVTAQITQIGSVVKVKWTSDEVGDSGWAPGWYKATVQKYDEHLDTITLKYEREPVPYEEELTPLISQGKITLLWSMM